MILSKLINRINKYRFRFIEGIAEGNAQFNKRALLYYKTEPYFRRDLLNDYVHTNLWEIIEITRILNEDGYIVDIIDRDVNNFVPKDIYDLFIGLGAGNSGKYFAKYASKLSKATKVLYAAGPNPYLSNRLVKERYDQFYERTGVKAPYMRTITELDFNECAQYADYIFCIGEAGGFSIESYSEFNIPIFPILPSTSPLLNFREEWLETRSRKKFLCFAGHGLICKGVDVLVEAFLKSPDLDLYVCGPEEQSLFQAYSKQLNTSHNIHYKGFVKIGSPEYNTLSSICSFTILNSAAEGCATSITTCMRSGLIPIVNYEVGISVADYGFLMNNKQNRINDIKNIINSVSRIDDTDYKQRVLKTIEYAKNFSQDGFTKSFKNALENIKLNQS